MTTFPYGLGLGRVHAPDSRDHGHRLRDALPAPSERRWRYWWAGGGWYDQQDTPTCVGHAWKHWLEDGPVTQPNSDLDPFTIYAEAQRADEWDGEEYEGTSVRAGAKVLAARGLITSYLWTWDIATLARAVLDVGPVVVGTNWYEDMFWPDANGWVRVGGGAVGGHAWLIDGVHLEHRSFRAKNSWGRSWGREGFFRIGFDDMQRLLDEDGEACRAVEVQV